jgi:hypothetical protein
MTCRELGGMEWNWEEIYVPSYPNDLERQMEQLFLGVGHKTRDG